MNAVPINNGSRSLHYSGSNKFRSSLWIYLKVNREVGKLLLAPRRYGISHVYI